MPCHYFDTLFFAIADFTPLSLAFATAAAAPPAAIAAAAASWPPILLFCRRHADVIAAARHASFIAHAAEHAFLLFADFAPRRCRFSLAFRHYAADAIISHFSPTPEPLMPLTSFAFARFLFFAAFSFRCLLPPPLFFAADFSLPLAFHADITPHLFAMISVATLLIIARKTRAKMRKTQRHKTMTRHRPRQPTAISST
jgi:hypothetical protein